MLLIWDHLRGIWVVFIGVVLNNSAKSTCIHVFVWTYVFFLDIYT